MANGTQAITQFKFRQIADEIRRLAGTLSAGARLPSERNLAQSFECNFLTVRKALQILVDECIIVRLVGSGTFVAGPATPGPDRPARPRGERVGILVYKHSDDYANRVLQAIARIALEESVDVRSTWIDSFGKTGLQHAQELINQGCSVLTLPWFPMDQASKVHAFVRALPVPVSLPMPLPGLERNCFERPEIYGTSSTRVTSALCRYFEMLGHRRIALLGPDSWQDEVLQKKLIGYARFVTRLNMENLCGFVGHGPSAMDELARRWSAYSGALAIVCYDDAHAFRFITSMHKLGLSAPKDFAIIGYNNTEISLHCDPPLTTVCQDYDYVGHWLLAAARALGEGKVAQSSEPNRLRMVIRESCGGRGRITPEMVEAISDLEMIEDETVPNSLDTPVEASSLVA